MSGMDINAPSRDDIESMARDAVAALPEPFRGPAAAIAIVVEDFAPVDMLADLDMDAFELTGLYDGIPMTQKSVMDQPTGPDTVWLFRRPIIDEWADRGNV